MNKHTPGPWTFYDDRGDGKTGRIEIVAMGKTVARIYNSVPAEDVPNARLIAAAPELLDALQTILNIALMDEGALARTIKAEARTALAKLKEKNT